MPHFLISYDLNGPLPTHKQVDEHLSKVSVQQGRVLETVWYARCGGTAAQLRDYLDRILTKNDQVIVVEISIAAWRNLLVTDEAMSAALLQPA